MTQNDTEQKCRQQLRLKMMAKGHEISAKFMLWQTHIGPA